MIISRHDFVSASQILIISASLALSGACFAGNPQLHVAALKKSPSIKVTKTTAPVSKYDNYLVPRPAKEGSDYVRVVLKALIDDVDITLKQDKLKAKLKKATPGQKALYAVYLLRNEVQFGGFRSYLSKKASNLLPEAREGLQLIGALNYLKLLNDTLDLFIDDEYMLDTALDRKNHLATISRNEAFRVFEKADAGFESLENESMLVDYMNSYINKHPKEFFKK